MPLPAEMPEDVVVLAEILPEEIPEDVVLKVGGTTVKAPLLEELMVLTKVKEMILLLLLVTTMGVKASSKIPWILCN
jgi:hypothetical protein